ncbi:MAG TPA: ABC transporter permease [Desulfobacterales bacterium]|nr:ABC transporter permease [Desulfobacterales bacterium]
MKWDKILRDAWRALLRHRLRSFLSSLGIVFAVVAVVAMLSIAEGAKQEILDQIDRLGTNSVIVRSLQLTKSQESAPRRRLSHGLTLSDANALENAIYAISEVAPAKEVMASLPVSIAQDPFEILAITKSYQVVKNLAIKQGRFISNADVVQKNLVCVLGEEISRLLGESGHLGEALRLEDRTYRIIGILHKRQWKRSKSPALAVRNYNRAIFIPIGTEVTDGLEQTSFGEISEIWLRVGQNNSVQACAEAVRRILNLRHGGVEDFQVVVPQELLNQAQKTQRIFNIILGCIAGISLLVGGIGIMNTMLASVAERTREIGIRRAIGAGQHHIIMQFICEAIVLTTIGGCLGIVLGAGSAVIISKVAGWKTVLTVWSIVTSILMAAGVGLASGLYPAIKAARLEPVRALRHE